MIELNGCLGVGLRKRTRAVVASTWLPSSSSTLSQPPSPVRGAICSDGFYL